MSVDKLPAKPVAIVGCGYIGKLLAQELLNDNISVTGIVSSESSKQACLELGITCTAVDLDNIQQDLNLQEHNVIYLVPPPPTGQKDTRITSFLNAIEKNEPNRFVLISTTGVYGNCNGNWIDETAALNPTADRAYRRADAEQQVEKYCQRHNIPLVILRVAGIYGPGKIPIARIKSEQPIVNQQDSPFTNRIHAYDLVSINKLALSRQDITGIYNVTDGTPGTMYEYFNGVAKALGLPAPPAISIAEAQQALSKGMLSYVAESRRISNKKLLEDFKLKLQYPTLKDGLKNVLD